MTVTAKKGTIDTLQLYFWAICLENLSVFDRIPSLFDEAAAQTE